MRFPAPSEATPNAFNRGNVVERLIGTRVIKHGIIELKRDPQGEITITIIPHDRSQSDAEDKVKPELRKY
jgi:hypothetical protein